MKKSIISLFVGLLGLGVFTTSCEDMLTPELERFATEFSGKDTVNFYAGILRNVQQVAEQNILLGELRGDLVTTTNYVTDSISDIVKFAACEDGDNALLNVAAYYNVINQCNFYLDKVDSTSCYNNYYYMRKETAQVLLIRAWTYMQLVQNYGKVPFITKPVRNSTTGWETTPPEGWATADNLVTLLHNDMEQAWSYCAVQGYPDYSASALLNTGVASVNSKLLNFDADVIYGDLYMMRGQDVSDFEKAAEHYYNFLFKENRTGNTVSNIASTRKDKRTTPPTFSVTADGWAGNAARVSYSFGGNEIVTGVPSAANTHFGLVLSRIPNIYGFDIHSSNSTSASEDSEGNSQVSTTGQVTIQPNYKVRQVEPSAAYVQLNKAQVICVATKTQGATDDAKPEIDYATNCYDGRMDYSAPLIETQDVGTIRYITKFGGSRNNVDSEGKVKGGFEFRYLLPLYRYRTIMLRYAEAINRAGFPGHAFAILRDGLDPETYPFIQAVQDTIVVADSTVYAHYALSPQSDKGPNYISDSELERARTKSWIYDIVNYSKEHHVGIREAGCGESLKEEYDSIYSYNYQIIQRLAEEYERTDDANLAQSSRRLVKMYEEELNEEENDTTQEEEEIDISNFKWVYAEPDPAIPEEILAMELLIADQYALETAFEGQRYYDLMRIARHLNKFGPEPDYGTKWMAWKIARRGVDAAPYDNPSQKDASIYNFFLNTDNWYLPLP